MYESRLSYTLVLALIAGSVIYVVILLMLRPFSADELARLTPIMPAPIQRLFVG